MKLCACTMVMQCESFRETVKCTCFNTRCEPSVDMHEGMKNGNAK